MRFLAAAGCAFVFLAQAALPPQPAFLLPDGVSPRGYNVELTIDPAQDTFQGYAQIEVQLSASTKVIWLNAKDLTPVEATAAFHGTQAIVHAEAVGGEFLGLELNSPAGPGPAVISIRYRGRLDDRSLVGAYRRKVENQWYVYTTFTPIDARRVFPCFDEPRFKAPWSLAIRVKPGDKAFSNGKEISETPEPDGRRLIRFARTQPLPSETVAFAVGPFDVWEGAPAGHGTPIRVLTSKGHQEEGRAAAQATVDILPWLEAYTAIPYVFGKLDHLALPAGAFSAVENPGLITYRAGSLLLGPGQETPEKTRAIRAIQAHEIAHQWFGNLVTQSTWDDVWLSESFATWFSDKIIDQEQPASRAHLAAIARRERIMAVDASDRSRPVRLEMRSREDTRGVYNGLIYDKGASILMMLEGWLGEDPVRTGIRDYLKTYQFSNAGTAQLASALARASGTDPAPVLHSFLDSRGIPVVRGEVLCPEKRLKITVENGTAVPVCYRGDGVAQSCVVVTSQSAEVALPANTACPAWMYWNAGGTGYYRTAWSAAQLRVFAGSEAEKLSASERMTLSNDLAWARIHVP